MTEHRIAAFGRMEARLRLRTRPAHLRRMAQAARAEAEAHEDKAAEARHRADYYDDLATEREVSR